MSIKNYKNFKKLQEIRRPKKCPVLSFKPIRESNTYLDMMDLGWIEVLADNPKGILAKATEEERSHKDRMGNIAFYHPSFKGVRLTRRATSNAPEGYPHFNIKHDGGVRVNEGINNTAEFPRLTTDLSRSCMTVEDYLFKMGFLIKYQLRHIGFPISEDELYNNENYTDLITRKIKEDPGNSRYFKDVDIPIETEVSKIPSSPKKSKRGQIPKSVQDKDDVAKGAEVFRKFGAWDKEEEDEGY